MQEHFYPKHKRKVETKAKGEKKKKVPEEVHQNYLPVRGMLRAPEQSAQKNMPEKFPAERSVPRLGQT